MHQVLTMVHLTGMVAQCERHIWDGQYMLSYLWDHFLQEIRDDLSDVL